MKEHKLSILRYSLIPVLLAFLFISLIHVNADAAPAISEVEYDGKGKIEVSFQTKVVYQNVKIKVRDSAGRKIKTKIISQECDEFAFRLINYQPGQTYRFKINGIKKCGEVNRSSITGKIRLPKVEGSVPVRTIQYEAKEKKVEFEFLKAVQLKSPVISITDGKKEYVIKREKSDPKELKIKVRKLKKGKVYKFSISGIRVKGKKKYTTITGTFEA